MNSLREDFVDIAKVLFQNEASTDARLSTRTGLQPNTKKRVVQNTLEEKREDANSRMSSLVL